MSTLAVCALLLPSQTRWELPPSFRSLFLLWVRSCTYCIYLHSGRIRVDSCAYGTFGKFLSKEHEFYVFRETLYQICDVYIDDLLIYGTDDDNFVQDVCTVFQKCREKNVTLSAKNYTWISIPSLFLVTSSTPPASTWRMKRIESTIHFPNTLTEYIILYSFLGLLQGPHPATFHSGPTTAYNNQCSHEIQTEANYLDWRGWTRLQYLEVVGQKVSKTVLHWHNIADYIVYRRVRLCPRSIPMPDTTKRRWHHCWITHPVS